MTLLFPAKIFSILTSPNVVPENAPNFVPENVVPENAANFVPENVVPKNAESAGNVVANAGHVWHLNFKDRFDNYLINWRTYMIDYVII